MFSTPAEKWEITNPAGIMEWAATKMCESKAIFFQHGEEESEDAFARLPFAYQNELLVLKVFSHSFTDENGEGKQSNLIPQPLCCDLWTGRRWGVRCHRRYLQDPFRGMDARRYGDRLCAFRCSKLPAHVLAMGVHVRSH